MNHALPELVQRYTAISSSSSRPVLVWENEASGRTYHQENFYLKWNPPGTGISLYREFLALQWIAVRHSAPQPVHYAHGAGDELLVTEAIPGESSHASWGIAHPRRAIESMATGL